jgi:radical SAM superfamily enzyme YgiQ (UPF0313 family)
MNILLYNPDNEVTNDFMPHLWMFVLKALTPDEHRVFLIDGNAIRLTEYEVANFVEKNDIELAGIGAMTRMAAKAYRMADAIRTAGAKVVMGGPHVTSVPEEALGRGSEPRHADAVALGEADNTWPTIVRDAARNELREVYRSIDASGKDLKPEIASFYPAIPWERMDLTQFNLLEKIPRCGRFVLEKLGCGWKSLYIIPMESGRGCPYGCDFCTVTGLFGESIRFRTNDSVIEELLRLKAHTRAENGKIGVFFVDDNFAINVKRTKSLLREIIARDAIVPWVGQISVNLLRDDELVDLIVASGGHIVFIGLESLDTDNLKGVSKGFNKPAEYKSVLDRLAERGIYTIPSFIFGMDGDKPGVAENTLQAVRDWPPSLPVFSLLTPYPATPLYDRLLEQQQLIRPKHWLDFRAFTMAFAPKNMTIDQAAAELHRGWSGCYSAAAIGATLDKIRDRPFRERCILFVSLLAFRGIYFPQSSFRQWATLLFQNRRTLIRIIREGLAARREATSRMNSLTTRQAPDRSSGRP